MTVAMDSGRSEPITANYAITHLPAGLIFEEGEAMANKDLSRNPHQIDALTWWCELPSGIEIHSDEHTKVGQHLRILIPWAKIRDALKHKDKKSE